MSVSCLLSAHVDNGRNRTDRRHCLKSRVGIWASLLASLLFTLAPVSKLRAQESSYDSSGAGGVLGGSGSATGASGGGAAMADFSTLMNLIQQTIDPDSWLANGGTSTILPYPSGVYIDPAGHMRRVEEAPTLTADLFTAGGPLRHPWKHESSMRVVSLKNLDRAVRNTLDAGLALDHEISRLAGISKITHVRIDLDAEDILLAGPASNGVHGFHLQDLVLMASHIRSATAPLGCSIDPTNAGLMEAQALVRQPDVVRSLARNPARIVQRMSDAIGPHNVTVFGIPANTPTAIALVDADEHMKKVGFGTVAAPVGVNRYFDHLDQMGGGVPKQSLIRWWFAFADDPVSVSSDGRLFQLPKNSVRVLSEQQWATAQGRAPTGNRDEAADAFAEGFTRQLPDLRRIHPSYARLGAIFELSLALQLAIESTGQPSLETWLPTLCQLGGLEAANTVAPKTVEGLAAWHRLNSGTVVAVVSGGVEIDARSLASTDSWAKSQFLSGSLVPELPAERSPVQARWWWDGR